MKFLQNILILCVMYNIVYSQQQQLLEEEIIRQQIQLLQRQLNILQMEKQRNQQHKITNFNIILPKAIIDDFEYIPTVQGYTLSYKLPDGSIRRENAFITGLRMDNVSLSDSRTLNFNAVGIGGRPKIMIKNRKLSPGSLKALAG